MVYKYYITIDSLQEKGFTWPYKVVDLWELHHVMLHLYDVKPKA